MRSPGFIDNLQPTDGNHEIDPSIVKDVDRVGTSPYHDPKAGRRDRETGTIQIHDVIVDEESNQIARFKMH
jgi:hypothetical protein